MQGRPDVNRLVMSLSDFVSPLRNATIQSMTFDATNSATSLTITRPDDWHLHVRDGDALHTVVPHTAAQFARAVIMPNLRPPVTTAAQALAYKSRIQAAVPAGYAYHQFARQS